MIAVLISSTILTPVSSFAARPECRLLFTLQRLPYVEQIRAAVEKVTLGKSPIGEWSNCDGGCNIYSAALFESLKINFWSKLRLREIRAGVTRKGEKNSLPRGMMHVFLADYGSEAPVIIDPTYLQFFRLGLRAPSIFVGTREDLIQFAERHMEDFLDRSDYQHLHGTVSPREFIETFWPVSDSEVAPYFTQSNFEG